jgi:phosphatidylglycerophosphate synthase
LLVRAVPLALLGLTLAVAAATGLAVTLDQDPVYPVRVGATYGLILIAALLGLTHAAHPHSRVGMANLFTGARALGVALLAGIALAPATPASGWWLVGIAAAGAAADAVDGPLARRSGLASRFGARFDMEIDALLILVLSVLVWRVVPLGEWVLVSGLLRYGFVAAGWMLPWMRADLPPSRRRQTVCVVQIVGFIAALSPLVSPGAAAAVSAAGLAALLWSFAVDVAWLWTTSRRRIG